MGSEQGRSEPSAIGTAVNLTLFRYCGHAVPFWILPNARRGRWHSIGDDPTQYWSSTPDAAWAELIRCEALRTEAELDLVRMPIWVCRLPAAGLIDLRGAEARGAAEISERDLVDDDWSACQRLGPALRESYSGVIAPSAALAGHASVTMFGPRRLIDWRGRPALASAVPTCIASIGRPRPGLLGSVRHRAGESVLREPES